MTLQRRRNELRLILSNTASTAVNRDETLIRNIARGHVWFQQWLTGAVTSLKDIAVREGLSREHVADIVHLAFLSPAVVQSILEGKQPAELNSRRLLAKDAIPLSWAQQTQQWIKAWGQANYRVPSDLPRMDQAVSDQIQPSPPPKPISQKELDFPVKGSGRVTAERTPYKMMEDDDIGEWFAKLTACLEDATGLAIEGQNPRLTLTERKVLLLKIQQQLTAVDRLTRQFGQPLFNSDSQEWRGQPKPATETKALNPALNLYKGSVSGLIKQQE